MGFEIIHAFLKRVENQGLLDLNEELNRTYQKLEMGPDLYSLREETIQIHERGPILEVPEYRAKYLRFSEKDSEEILIDENLL
jgi:hypothetical protein